MLFSGLRDISPSTTPTTQTPKSQVGGFTYPYKQIRLKSGEIVVLNGNYIDGRIKSCKTKTLVFRHLDDNCFEQRTIKNSCLNRICPKCEPTRRNRYAKKYSIVGEFQKPKFLTLTIAKHHLLTKEFVKEIQLQLRNFIKRLNRRYGEFSYIRILEIVPKPNGLYYYHFHFVVDLPYIRQQTISNHWNECTNGSSIVDIRALRDENGNLFALSRVNKQQKTKSVIAYITKYLAKPLPNMDSDLYARVMYGKQLSHMRKSKTLLNLINVQNSSIKSGLICPKCGCLLHYSHSEEIIENKPPDKTLKEVF